MENNFYETLISPTRSIGQRYQAVFQLKNLGTLEAIKLLMQAYDYCGSSVLLKHELLYALGQLPQEKYPHIKDFLVDKVNDVTQNNLSRHQAAEGLANYFKEQLIPLYQQHLDSTCKQLKWTCQIAVEKVKNLQLQKLYGTKYNKTMQPAAPFTEQQFINFLNENDLKQLFQSKKFLGLLVREDIPLFLKYRILYHMRDLNNEECRKTLCLLLSKKYYETQTSLLKHEICFIIGQIGCENFQDLVRQCIQNQSQEEIVRHQALAAVASQSKDAQYLQKFIQNPSQLVRESAEVAIYTIKYWNQS